MKLIDLANEYHEAAERMADMGLPDEAIADTLEGMAGDFEDKAKAVASVILSLEAEAKAQNEFAKRLQDKAKTGQARAEWLRKYLADQLHRVGKDSISDPILPVRIVPNPESVIVPDVSAVPDKFIVVKETRHADKKAIKAILKAGQKVNWASLSRGERLKIGV